MTERHPVEDCEACQANLILYGVSYLDTATGKHIDPPELLIIVGPINKKLQEGLASLAAEIRAERL